MPTVSGHKTWVCAKHCPNARAVLFVDFIRARVRTEDRPQSLLELVHLFGVFGFLLLVC
jgi:hypothetical protein